jgi:phosphatidylethanolamine-binding protein (PEBP) family uncharacterized protein
LAELNLSRCRSPLVGRPSLVAALFLALAFAGCGGTSGSSAGGATSSTVPGTSRTSSGTHTDTTRAGIGAITLSSTAFTAAGAMPARYTCDGAGLSPPLQWTNVPNGTAELFLLAIDLSGGRADAIQWAVGGLSPSLRGIAAGRVPSGAVIGRNSAGKTGWDGICGARGRTHHVAFLLYALSRKLGLKSGFNPARIRAGLSSATLARGLTVATYHRS